MNKRSDWYKGLLEAEYLYKDGWKYDCHDQLRIQFRHGEATLGFYDATYESQPSEFRTGCLDYLKHIGVIEE